MNKTNPNEVIENLLNETKKALYVFEDKITEEAVKKLRKLYKGKMVRFTCYDALCDGDDYDITEKIVDIRTYRLYKSNDFIVVIDVMYQGIFDKKPTLHQFFLDKILEIDGVAIEQDDIN